MGSAIGKRYTCPVCESQVLVVRGGEGVVACHGREMEVLQPKPLPSSD